MNLNQIYKKSNSKNCPDRCGKLLERDTKKKVYPNPDTNLKRHLQPNFYTALPLLEENKLTDAFLHFVNTFNTCLKTQQVKIEYTGKSKKCTSKILLIFNYLCALLLCVSITIFCIDSQFYEGNKLKLLSKILFSFLLPLLLYINQY